MNAHNFIKVCVFNYKGPNLFSVVTCMGPNIFSVVFCMGLNILSYCLQNTLEEKVVGEHIQKNLGL